MRTAGHLVLMQAAADARKRKIPNPLPYVTGVALGDYLRHNDYPQPNVKQGPPIVIPGDRPRRQRRGPFAY